MSEDMIPIPEDSYGISKLAVEQELRVSHEMFGLDYVVFRPHNVYGERQNIGDRYRNVVGIFMNQLLRGEPMTIFGDGTQQRAFTHIDDVAPIIAASVDFPEARNQIFNVGADVPHTVNELAEVVAEAIGKPCKVDHLDRATKSRLRFPTTQRLNESSVNARKHLFLKACVQWQHGFASMAHGKATFSKASKFCETCHRVGPRWPR